MKEHDNTNNNDDRRNSSLAISSTAELLPSLSSSSDHDKGGTSRRQKNHHRKKKKKNGSTQQTKKVALTKEERRVKYTAIAHNRRDANIARARDKHLICYRCRKMGHSAENCKNVSSSSSSAATAATTATGDSHSPNTNWEGMDGKRLKKQRIQGGKSHNNNICYKCGSTEHRIQSCPKIKPFLKLGSSSGGGGELDTTRKNKIDFGKLGELPYANCFICNQTGHLASHCPGSTRGLYPLGGSCRECGSVYHLGADCPEKKSPKGGTKHRVETNDDDNDVVVSDAPSSSQSVFIDQYLDDEDIARGVKENKEEQKTKKRKVVRF